LNLESIPYKRYWSYCDIHCCTNWSK